MNYNRISCRAQDVAVIVSAGSLPWEVGNALSALFKKKKIADLKPFNEIIKEFGNIPIHLVHIELQEAVDLCFRRGIYAYDAYMILCAR